MTYDEIVDDEDTKRDDEIEFFETAYNFRFEEEGFEKLKSYPREVKESVRKVDDTRKKAREAKKEREKLSHVQKTEELKRLKNFKQQEIMDRLKIIDHYAGTTTSILYTDLSANEFDEEFDPDKHERLMGEIFNDTYYEVEDRDVEIKEEYKAKNDDRTNDVDLEKVEKSEDLPIGMKEGAPGDWWMCDGCETGISEGHLHFDCMECDSFTLCAQCRTSVVHEHRLKKLKVPIGCKPPDQIVHILCDICNKDITQAERFDCSKCKDFSICESCLPNSEHPHELRPANSDMWEEYYNLNYEDMVAGVPCRFKYRKVDAADYGLTDEDILKWDDSMLNQLISLKKIAPYRTDGGNVNASKLRRKYKFLKTQIKQKKRRQAEEVPQMPDSVSSRMQSYGLDK